MSLMLTAGLGLSQLATVSPQFHKILHGPEGCHQDADNAHEPQRDPADSSQEDHRCAVTLLSQGVVADAPTVLIGHIQGRCIYQVPEALHCLPSREAVACLARGPPAKAFV